MPKERGSDGQYRTTVSREDVLGVFDAVRGPVVTSADVADALDVTRETARRKLNALVDDDTLAKRKTAGRVVYWRTADAESGRERAETTSAGAGDDTSPADVPGRERAQTPTDDAARDESDAVDGVLEGWRPGRSPGEKREQRQAAGRAALDYLRAQGVATAAEFRQDIEPEHPVNGQSPETWWRKTALPVLKRAQDAGVVTFTEGSKEWRWTESGT